MAQLKYKSEIDALLLAIIDYTEDWLTEADKQEAVDDLLEMAGLTYVKLEQDIETGINNGYSLDFQMKLLKDLIKSYPNF